MQWAQISSERSFNSFHVLNFRQRSWQHTLSSNVPKSFASRGNSKGAMHEVVAHFRDLSCWPASCRPDRSVFAAEAYGLAHYLSSSSGGNSLELDFRPFDMASGCNKLQGAATI